MGRILTPLRQRPVTAVRRPGELIVPKRNWPDAANPLQPWIDALTLVDTSDSDIWSVQKRANNWTTVSALDEWRGAGDLVGTSILDGTGSAGAAMLGFNVNDYPLPAGMTLDSINIRHTYRSVGFAAVGALVLYGATDGATEITPVYQSTGNSLTVNGTWRTDLDTNVGGTDFPVSTDDINANCDVFGPAWFIVGSGAAIEVDTIEVKINLS